MGNYQEHLKKQPSPLRELENTPSRVHMFGNPFKVNKVGALIVKPCHQEGFCFSSNQILDLNRPVLVHRQASLEIQYT